MAVSKKRFGGKVFTLIKDGLTKQNAEIRASKLRQQGFLVRIAFKRFRFFEGGAWQVWARKKR